MKKKYYVVDLFGHYIYSSSDYNECLIFSNDYQNLSGRNCYITE